MDGGKETDGAAGGGETDDWTNEESGDEASGLAMRSPPKDCDKLKSPSMAADTVCSCVLLITLQ